MWVSAVLEDVVFTVVAGCADVVWLGNAVRPFREVQVQQSILAGAICSCQAVERLVASTCQPFCGIEEMIVALDAMEK